MNKANRIGMAIFLWLIARFMMAIGAGILDEPVSLLSSVLFHVVCGAAFFLMIVDKGDLDFNPSKEQP